MLFLFYTSRLQILEFHRAREPKPAVKSESSCVRWRLVCCVERMTWKATGNGRSRNGAAPVARTRLCRWVLQHLASETGMKIERCHYPLGTGKWNEIEQRLYCHITGNSQGLTE